MHRAAAFVAIVFVSACGSSPPAPATPSSEGVSAAAAPPPIDAAAIDAGPPAELLAAPAWVFRYNAPPRVETWTLRHHGGLALVDVETAQATTRYAGTAAEGTSLALEVASPTTTMRLDCKPASRPIGATCADRKGPPLDVLDCYHPDFAAPMTFAPAPGIEFAASCNGYQRLR